MSLSRKGGLRRAGFPVCSDKLRNLYNLDDLVGIPYVSGGRGLDGADCWGTIRLYYAMQGIDLPSYDGPTIPSDHEAVRAARDGASPWRAVSVPAVGDLGLWKRPFRALHAGVMVDVGLVLHNDSLGRGSAIVRVREVIGGNPEWWRYGG